MSLENIKTGDYVAIGNYYGGKSYLTEKRVVRTTKTLICIYDSHKEVRYGKGDGYRYGSSPSIWHRRERIYEITHELEEKIKEDTKVLIDEQLKDYLIKQIESSLKKCSSIQLSSMVGAMKGEMGNKEWEAFLEEE